MIQENSQNIQDIPNVSSNNPSVKNNIDSVKSNELFTTTEGNTKKNNNKNKKVKNKDSERRYGYDCLRKKIKHLVLEYSFLYINEKIDKDNKLKKIGYSQINNIKMKFEDKFMKKTLREIFSNKISGKYKEKEKENYNKERINKIIDNESKKETNEQNLTNIFNIKFIDCLKYFFDRNTDKNIEKNLEGMKKFQKIRGDIEDKDLISNLEDYASNYEKFVSKDKARKPKTKKKK